MSKSISFRRASKRKFLVFSILISIALHAIEIRFLQKQGIWFLPQETPSNRADKLALSIEKKEKNQVLKESFGGLTKSKARGASQILAPIKESNQISLCFEHPVPSTDKTNLQENDSFSLHLSTFVKAPMPEISPFEMPPLKEKLPKRSLFPIPYKEPERSLLPTALTQAIATSKNIPKESLETNPTFTYEPSKVPQDSSQVDLLGFTPPLMRIAPPILKIPSLLELQTTSYSSSFDTELVFCEQEEGSYLFALTLIPKQNLKLEPLRQNYIFLLDRSNSIQKDRLNAAKNALRKALEEIREEDRFNIVAFDQKVDKLSAMPVPGSSEYVEKAQSFIANIELGSFFSHKNLSKPLFSTVPFKESPDEVYTAILITDGDNLSQRGQVQMLAHDWTQMNQGKVSLFTLGLNEDPHLNVLDTVANLNRGKTVFSPTNRGLKRKLMKLMKSISSPLAKDLTCSAIPKAHKSADIEIFPKGKSAPHLFLNEPYVILGKTNSLEDFVLFVQGKLSNEWLHIKKNISFSNGKKGSPSLAADFALSKSASLYQKYLEGAGIGYLVEAKQVSKDYKLPGVFE